MDISIINPIAATPDLDASSLLHPATTSRALSRSGLQEVNIVELGRAMADLGHRVTILLGSAYLAEQPVTLSPNLAVVPVHTLMPFPFHPGLLPMTPSILRDPATLEADIIQSGEFHQPSTFFAAEVSLDREIPLVLWQETFGPMQFPGSLYQRSFEATCGRKVRAAATRCVPRTSKARDYLRSLHVRDESIRDWIPTGIDLTQFRPRPSKSNVKDFGWGDGCEILLVVARLSPTKGVDRALRILKRLHGRRPGLRLLVRGSGPQEAELRRLANSLDISDLVRFVPRQSRTEMVDLYNLATVVLSTSRFDLLPFALMEASACGRPIVATDAGAVTDIVVDGTTGAVVRGSDDDRFGEALEALLKDSGRQVEYGRAARERAEACFDLRITAKRLIEVYHGTAA